MEMIRPAGSCGFSTHLSDAPPYVAWCATISHSLLVMPLFPGSVPPFVPGSRGHFPRSFVRPASALLFNELLVDLVIDGAFPRMVRRHMTATGLDLRGEKLVDPLAVQRVSLGNVR